MKIFVYNFVFQFNTTVEDKSVIEQMHLMQQLDEDDKNTIFKQVNIMLTNKKFKEFFNKNVATL